MRRVVLLSLLVPSCAFALGQVMPTPPGSQAFGTEVVFLPNGNFVVTDPGWSGAVEEAGAVYLYAPDGTLVSRLTGSRASDSVGAGGIVVLANGNFVVRSPFWDAPGPVADVGAVTFGDAETGFGGEVVVSEANSLVGASAFDRAGSPGVFPLANGNYVVASDHLRVGNLANAGAVTWGDGGAGTSGVVGPANSLVGAATGDHVGFRITVLPNGNYVVASPLWDNAGMADVGAVTLRPGDAPAPAVVDSANSIIGASAGDQIGMGSVTAVGNDAVIASPNWDNGAAFNAGAVTWMSGTLPMAFAVGEANSFVGTSKGDNLGSGGVVALAGGNFAFASPLWDRGALVDAGAITVGLADASKAGAIDAGNSTVGGSADDEIGSRGLTALPNGDFVALSPAWNDAAVADAGAATRLRGDGSSAGTLDGAASLRGAFAGDLQFAAVTVLANGNYVVRSSTARAGALLQAGAVAWCPGDADCAKLLGPATALTGARANDSAGTGGVLALPDGNYIVASPVYDTDAAVDAGAITWADGETGIAGAIGPANSLVGAAADDGLGGAPNLALANGGYVVFSSTRAGPGGAEAGSATFLPGGQPLAGTIDQYDSVFAPGAGDYLGVSGQARATADHQVIVRLPRTANGAAAQAGAIAVFDASHAGVLDLDASGFRGTVAGGGALMRFDWHEASRRLVASDPASSRVWLASLPVAPAGEAIFRDGFE